MPIVQQGASIGGIGLMKVQMFTWYNGQMAVNSFWYDYVHPGFEVIRLGQMAEKFAGIFATDLPGMCGNGVKFVGVKVSSRTANITETPGIFVDGTNIASANDPITTGVTGLIKWTTRLAGPSFRGRTYMPFPPRSDVNAKGEISAGLQEAYLEFAQTLINTETFVFAIDSVTVGFILNSIKLGIQEEILEGRPETLVASLRKRAARGQQNPPIIV